MVFAGKVAYLDAKPKNSKLSNREHLTKVHKITGKMPPELELPEIPQPVRHVWGWFNELYNGEPLSYTEIMNWCQLLRQKPTAAEVRLLKSVDNAYRRVKNDINLEG